MVDVLVRAADAGDTYLSWRWLDDPDRPGAERLDRSRLASALDDLDGALLSRRPGETEDQASRRVVTTGPFATPEGEYALASSLAAAVLPSDLVDALIRRTGEGVRIRLTPSPRLARVPWETLVLDGERRLLDVADIVCDPPTAVRETRSVTPDSWSDRAGQPSVYVIDPETATARLSRVIGPRTREAGMLKQRIATGLAAGSVDPAHAPLAISKPVTRHRLGDWLVAGCARLFYYGHVTAEPGEPGSAALHLSDRAATTWGMANAVDSHLPLTALDLLLGTTLAPPEVWARRGGEPLAGHQIWPMPPRIAIIACEGGADFRSSETFGLVVAMIDAGAELVTTTRWPLPTDGTLLRCRSEVGDARPTTALALAVDDAHAGADPIGEVLRWQRAQLDEWRREGNPVNTPLIWASLINTSAPA